MRLRGERVVLAIVGTLEPRARHGHSKSGVGEDGEHVHLAPSERERGNRWAACLS